MMIVQELENHPIRLERLSSSLVKDARALLAILHPIGLRDGELWSKLKAELRILRSRYCTHGFPASARSRPKALAIFS